MTEKFLIWLAWKLPRNVVYWCYIRVHSEATTGGVLHPDEVSWNMALKSWERDG